MQANSNSFSVQTLPASNLSSSIVEGQVISGSMIWTATDTSAIAPTTVLFTVPGLPVWPEGQKPYQFNGDPAGKLNTLLLPNGPIVLTVKSTYPNGTLDILTVNAMVQN